MVPNRRYQVCDLEGFQPAAFPEGAAANGRKPGRELQLLQATASPEGIAANGGQALWEIEAFQCGTPPEGAATNGSHAIAENNRSDPSCFQGLIVDPVCVAAVDTRNLDGHFP